MSTAHNAPKQALSGLRVIDAATLGAAPLAAAMMAEFGADVIKVEHPKRGDPLIDEHLPADIVGEISRAADEPGDPGCSGTATRSTSDLWRP